MTTSKPFAFAAVFSIALCLGQAASAEDAPIPAPPVLTQPDAGATGSTTTGTPGTEQAPIGTVRPILPVRRNCQSEVTS